MNRTYASYFPVDRLPARTTIGVTGLAAVRWSKSPASSTMRSTSTISTLTTVFAVLAQRKMIQNDSRTLPDHTVLLVRITPWLVNFTHHTELMVVIPHQ